MLDASQVAADFNVESNSVGRGHQQKRSARITGLSETDRPVTLTRRPAS